MAYMWLNIMRRDYCRISEIVRFNSDPVCGLIIMMKIYIEPLQRFAYSTLHKPYID